MPEAAEARLSLLPELPERQAGGAVRQIYEQIKRLSGVPMVALIYRHLATIPGALKWSWELLEPSLRAGQLQQRAWDLASDARITPHITIPRAALRAVGIAAADERGITAVLDAYNRANPVNIMALRCLALHLAGDVQAVPRTAALPPWQPPPVPQAPPIIDPPAMTPEVRQLALLLTDRGAGGTPPTLWPGLYRHLAHWPAFLGFAGVLVPREFAAIDAAAARLREQVDAAAKELAAGMKPANRPAPGAAERRQLQAAIAQFSARIPEMVVIGGVLRRALPTDAFSRGDSR